MLDAAGFGLQCLSAVIGGLAVLSVVLALTTRAIPSPTRGVSLRDPERFSRWLLRIPVPARFTRRFDRPELATDLRHSSLALDSRRFIALQWAALLGACACLGALLVLRPVDPLSGLLAVLFLAAGALGPRLWLKLQVQRRQMEITLSLPDLLDRLAFGLQAGLGFEVVLRRVAPTFPGPLGEELRGTIQDLDLGWRRDQAMDGLARNTGSLDVRGFVAAVRQAEVLGTPLADALRVQNDLLRTARRRRAQEASRRLPVIILFPLVFFFLPALLIVYLAPPLLHLFLLR